MTRSVGPDGLECQPVTLDESSTDSQSGRFECRFDLRFSLVEHAAGQQSTGTRSHDCSQLFRQRDEHAGDQIGGNQVVGLSLGQRQRALAHPNDIRQAIAGRVRARRINGKDVRVDGEDRFRTEQAGTDRQDPRAGAHVQHLPTADQPLVRPFLDTGETEPGRRVEAGPERHARVERDDNLVGLPCVDDAGNVLGSVAGIENFGAGDLIEVLLPNGKRSLIPFRDPIAVLSDDKIVLDPNYLA